MAPTSRAGLKIEKILFSYFFIYRFKFLQIYSTKLPKLSKLHNLESQFSELLRPPAPPFQKIKRNPLIKPDHFQAKFSIKIDVPKFFEMTVVMLGCNLKITYILIYFSIYRFNSLEMELHSRCRYDFVAAFNGNSTSSTNEIGRYCGNQTSIPPILKSESNVMTVQFRTDHSVNAGG